VDTPMIITGITVEQFRLAVARVGVRYGDNLRVEIQREFCQIRFNARVLPIVTGCQMGLPPRELAPGEKRPGGWFTNTLCWHTDFDLPGRAHPCQHPGQRPAVPEFVSRCGRHARPRGRPTPGLLRRADRHDAPTAAHPRPKPRRAHRHRTPTQPRRPDSPARRASELRRPGPTRDRGRPPTVLDGEDIRMSCDGCGLNVRQPLTGQPQLAVRAVVERADLLL
jgi:hypothetical protein